MSFSIGGGIRRLPQGVRTRDELKSLLEKHGFLSETDVLAHINKSAKPAWTHENFVAFFQESEQMVFVVKNDRLYIAPSVTDSDSDSEPLNVRSEPPQVQTNASVKNANPQETSNLNPAGSSSGGSGSTSTTTERRREQRSAARQPPPSSSSDDDNNHSERLKNPEEVLKLVNSSRRYFPSYANAASLVTMEPQAKDKVVPKVKLGLAGDHSSSNDSDDESSDSEKEAPNVRSRPPPVQQQPQASLQERAADRTTDGAAKPPTSNIAAPRVLLELNGRKPTFKEGFFAAKEDRDFNESRERNPEKVLKDVMEYGDVSLDDARSYYDYFILLQSFSIDCLSNSQLIAGVLALIEADPERNMLHQIRQVNERLQEL